MDLRQNIISIVAVFSFLFVFSSSSCSDFSNQVGTVVNLIEKKDKNCEKQKSFFKDLGNHIIAEFTGSENLNNSEELEKVLRDAAVAAGATVLSVTVHKFEPFGMTGVAVLQESHISVHTWPEYGYASIDIYTCGHHVHIEEALKELKKFFLPKKVQAVSVNRGFENKEYVPSEIKEEYRMNVLQP